MPEPIPLRPLTTAEPARQNLSPSEIAAPFNTLSTGFEKIGDTAEATARKLAQDAGRDAVRTDDAGNLVVDKAPIIGPASAEYANAARSSYLSKQRPKIESDLLEMRLSDPYNFDGFKAKADAYGKKLTADISDPHLKDAVGDVVAQNAAHNWRTMRVEADHKNLSDFISDSQATLKDITEKRGSLARQGGVWLDDKGNLQSTPEFAGLATDYRRIIDNLVADPRTKYSPARADLEIKQQGASDFVQMKIGEVQRQFMKDQDIAKATRDLMDAFHGPGSERWNLTNQQRDHGVSEGLAHLRNLAAGSHEEIQEHRKNVHGFIDNLLKKPGDNFPLQEFNDLRQRAEDLKDRISLGALDQFREEYPLAKTMLQGGPERRSDYLGTMKQGIVPFFRLQSSFDKMMTDAPPDVRAGVSIFSGMRTTEHQAELYAAAVKKYGSEEEARKWVAPPGHSQHEKGNAADLRYATPEAREWMHANAGKYGLTFPLANEPWHIERADARGDKVGGLIEGQQVDRTASSFAGSQFQKLVGILTPMVSKDAEAALARIEKNAKEGAAIPPDDVIHLGEMARRSGNEEVLDKAKPWLAALDMYHNQPPGQTFDVTKAWIAEQRSKGLTPMQADALDHFEAISKAHDERFAQNPRAESAAAGWTGAPGPLQFSTADAGELAKRQKDAAIINQHAPNTGTIPAIMPEEAKRLATVLQAGDPKQAADFLSTLRGTLTPANYSATMTSPPVKDAMLGMFNSNIPARLDAAGMALDHLWGLNGQEFEAKYGTAAADRLIQWKGLQGFDPELRAKKMSDADDPSLAESRKKAGEAADAEFTGWFAWTPQKAADAIGNFWRRNVPGVHAAMPRDIINGDDIAGGAMLEDFRRAYRINRMSGADASTAVTLAGERVHAQWQPTQLMGTGTKLMKNAPETFYPTDPIAKNHDWMKTQLEDQITAIHGSRQQIVTGETGQSVIRGWDLRGIAADPQTQREALAFDKNRPIKMGADDKGPANRPPSYRVFVTDAKGQDQVLRNPETGQDRFTWDPALMLKPRQTEAAQMSDKAGRSAARNLHPMPGGPTPALMPGLQGELDLERMPGQGQEAQKKSELTQPELGVVQKGFLKGLNLMESISPAHHTALKLYNDVVQRGRTEQITEKDFPEHEQIQLRDLVLSHSAKNGGQDSGKIDYKDYVEHKSALDQNILGGFKYSIAKNGDISITDTYDFNKDREGPSIERNPFMQILGAIANPRGLAAQIGRDVVPDTGGKGIPVRIKLKGGR